MYAILLLVFIGWFGLSYLYAKMFIRRNILLSRKVKQLTAIGSIATPFLYSVIGLLSVNFFQDPIDSIIQENKSKIVVYNILAAFFLVVLPVLPVWIGKKILEFKFNRSLSIKK